MDKKMDYFIENKIGRIFVIKLEPGDYLKESITELAHRENIENAVIVTGIATFDEVNIHMTTTLDYPIGYHKEQLQEPLELGGLDGFIADGEPHLHGVIGNADRTWAGHLLDGCRVLYLAEIVVQELIGTKLIRKENSKGAFLLYKKDAQ
jgi:predicted DNA-binding protein with PD1-like motif